jgi:VWFA-related protein
MSLSQRVCLAVVVCLPVFSWAQRNPATGAFAGQSEAASQSASQAAAVSPRSAPHNGEGRIHLDVVVTDKAGDPVSGLGLQNFTLLDNNHPNKILSFRPGGGGAQKADLPVEVILLLDAVNLRHDRVEYEREEVKKYLRQNGGHLAQPVSVFLLSYKGVYAQPRPSTDGNALAANLEKLEIPWPLHGEDTGGVGALERFQVSVKMLAGIVKSEAKKPNRKLLLWASQGWPLFNSFALEVTSKAQQQFFDQIVEFSTGMREERLTPYSISPDDIDAVPYLFEDFLKGVKSPREAYEGNLDLKVLVTQNGGLILGPDNDLVDQINRCIQDANAFYTLSFDPPHAAHANEYHDLKVLVDKPGLTVRTNTGYYNQP